MTLGHKDRKVHQEVLESVAMLEHKVYVVKKEVEDHKDGKVKVYKASMDLLVSKACKVYKEIKVALKCKAHKEIVVHKDFWDIKVY
jgi:hypothetical protein